MQTDALAAMKPGVPFRDIHLVAARRLSSDFKALGLLRGDVSKSSKPGRTPFFSPMAWVTCWAWMFTIWKASGKTVVGYTEDIRRDNRLASIVFGLAKPLEPGVRGGPLNPASTSSLR